MTRKNLRWFARKFKQIRRLITGKLDQVPETHPWSFWPLVAFSVGIPILVFLVIQFTEFRIFLSWPIQPGMMWEEGAVSILVPIWAVATGFLLYLKGRNSAKRWDLDALFKIAAIAAAVVFMFQYALGQFEASVSLSVECKDRVRFPNQKTGVIVKATVTKGPNNYLLVTCLRAEALPYTNGIEFQDFLENPDSLKCEEEKTASTAVLIPMMRHSEWWHQYVEGAPLRFNPGDSMQYAGVFYPPDNNIYRITVIVKGKRPLSRPDVWKSSCIVPVEEFENRLPRNPPI